MYDLLHFVGVTLVQGPFILGPFVPGPFVLGLFVQGLFVLGLFVQGPFVQVRTNVRVNICLSKRLIDQVLQGIVIHVMGRGIFWRRMTQMMTQKTATVTSIPEFHLPDGPCDH